MKHISAPKCFATLCAVSAIALAAGGCGKQPEEQKSAEKPKTSFAEAGEAIKDAATKTGEAIKDNAQTAIDATKTEVQKVSGFVTNVAGQTTTVATNVAAKVKEGAQKIEVTATNIFGEIKGRLK